MNILIWKCVQCMLCAMEPYTQNGGEKWPQCSRKCFSHKVQSNDCYLILILSVHTLMHVTDCSRCTASGYRHLAASACSSALSLLQGWAHWPYLMNTNQNPKSKCFSFMCSLTYLPHYWKQPPFLSFTLTELYHIVAQYQLWPHSAVYQG